jgi:hypothetical protein
MQYCLLGIVITSLILPLSSPASSIVPPPGILPPDKPKICAVWLLPPSVLRRAGQDFLSSAIAQLLVRPNLAIATELTIKLALDSQLITNLDEHQARPFKIETSARGHRLILSPKVAKHLTEAADLERASLITTAHSASAELVAAWLDALAVASFHLSGEQASFWDQIARRLAWSAAYHDVSPPTERDIAQELWPTLVRAHEEGRRETIAQILKSMEKDGTAGVTSPLERDIKIAQGQFRDLFFELGLYAAAGIKQSDHAMRYNDLYYRLAREFESSNLIVPAKITF